MLTRLLLYDRHQLIYLWRNRKLHPVGLRARDPPPPHVRAKGTAVGVSSNWLWNFFVVMVTSTLLANLQWKDYLIFMCLNFAFCPARVRLLPRDEQPDPGGEMYWLFMKGDAAVQTSPTGVQAAWLGGGLGDLVAEAGGPDGYCGEAAGGRRMVWARRCAPRHGSGSWQGDLSVWTRSPLYDIRLLEGLSLVFRSWSTSPKGRQFGNGGQVAVMTSGWNRIGKSNRLMALSDVSATRSTSGDAMFNFLKTPTASCLS